MPTKSVAERAAAAHSMRCGLIGRAHPARNSSAGSDVRPSGAANLGGRLDQRRLESSASCVRMWARRSTAARYPPLFFVRARDPFDSLAGGACRLFGPLRRLVQVWQLGAAYHQTDRSEPLAVAATELEAGISWP